MTPIRKGSNPVKIPFAIKSTDPTFAAWANETRTAIRQLEARMPTANMGRRGAGASAPLFGSISQVPESSPAEYQARFTLGYLTYHNANAAEAEQGVTGYLVPKIRNTRGDWISMDEVAPVVIPAVPLPALASWVYLRVKTTSDGMPDFEQDDGPVTIEAFDSEQKSIHHVRPSPNGEEAGDYYFLLLETESNGATPTPSPRAKRRITGNRELPNQLIEITNIGGKRELYQGYLAGPDDKHELRTIEQLDGGGAAIIKPLDEGEEEGETIKWRDIKKNNDSAVPYTIIGDGDSVKVQFNGLDGPYIDAFGGQINFAAGIATTTQGGAFNGWWGTVQWVNLASSATIIQTFRSGILTSVFAGAYGVGIEVPGTEGNPGVVSAEF